MPECEYCGLSGVHDSRVDCIAALKEIDDTNRKEYERLAGEQETLKAERDHFEREMKKGHAQIEDDQKEIQDLKGQAAGGRVGSTRFAKMATDFKAERDKLKVEAEKTDKELEELVTVREQREDELAEAAAEAGCAEEWSNLHDHGDCIVNHIAHLKAERVKLKEFVHTYADSPCKEKAWRMEAEGELDPKPCGECVNCRAVALLTELQKG